MKKEICQIHAEPADKTSVACARGGDAFKSPLVDDATSRSLLARVSAGSGPNGRFCRVVLESASCCRANTSADPEIWHGWCHSILGHPNVALRSGAKRHIPRRRGTSLGAYRVSCRGGKT